MIKQKIFTWQTCGRGMYECTDTLNAWLQAEDLQQGIVNLFLQHTSASLVICENADPTVQEDVLDDFKRRFVDGDPRYHHCFEGDDDMSAHLRTLMTGCSLTLPVAQGRLCLGTWQGVFLFEHRESRHNRRLVASFLC